LAFFSPLHPARTAQLELPAMDERDIQPDSSSPASVQDALRIFYLRFSTAVKEAIDTHADYVVLTQLTDDLQEFRVIVENVGSLICQVYIDY
jgi:hypothetical protein